MRIGKWIKCLTCVFDYKCSLRCAVEPQRRPQCGNLSKELTDFTLSASPATVGSAALSDLNYCQLPAHALDSLLWSMASLLLFGWVCHLLRSVWFRFVLLPSLLCSICVFMLHFMHAQVLLSPCCESLCCTIGVLMTSTVG